MTEVHVSIRIDPVERERCQELLAEAGLRATFFGSVDDFVRRMHECRYLLIGRPPRIDFSPAVRLELLQVAGAGVDPLFPAVGLRDAVAIASCRGVHADGVRDHVLAFMLAFARELPRVFAQQRAKNWLPFARAPLTGKKLVLLGYGAIGTRVAHAARALGMSVAAVRRSARPEPELERVYGPAELEQAVTDADFFVIAAPLTSATRGLVAAPVLSALPAHAVLINVSRGSLLDERALETALRAGRLAGAALDVFEHEPLAPASTLWDCPRLVVSPHVAGYEPAYLAKACQLFAENVRRVERGEAPLAVVSRALEY